MYFIITKVQQIVSKYLGPNQRKILKILEGKSLSVIEIASLVYEKPVKYKTKEYFSVHRSLKLLETKGLVVSTPRRRMWSLKPPIKQR